MARKPYRPAIDWPIRDLEVGQSFAMPMTPTLQAGPHGHPVGQLRVRASAVGQQLGRKFSLNADRAAGTLTVTRRA